MEIKNGLCYLITIKAKERGAIPFWNGYEMLKLPGIFGNNMVIQRDRSFIVWGTEDAAPEVTVVFEGRSFSGEVKDGSFRIELPSHPSGTDLSMEIKGSSSILLTGICFGDVFYLGGQSNMELPVSRTMDVSKEEIEHSDYPYIRQYRVTPQYNMEEGEIADLPENPWVSAVPGSIGEISAAGFYCSRRIYDEKKIPIGLVLGAQGGSTIESWMPSELLSKFGDYEDHIRPFQGRDTLKQYNELRDHSIAAWRETLESPEDQERVDLIPEGAGDFAVPGMLLEKNGNGYTGIVWFYRDFELKNEPQEDAFLYLGNLIDADQTFINGHAVGRIEYRYPPRKYPFDGSILRKGRNRITVRLLIENGSGGFVAEHPYYVRSGEETVDITGLWKISYGVKAEKPVPHFYMGQEVPTSLYRASVIPLKDYSFSGIWWYQGESNSSDPERYKEKFSDMIDHWRALYQQDLPVICIEMCDYTDPVTGETPSGWKEIQEQQRQAEKDVVRCRVVSAKDLYDPLDLHPQRKSELGARMAEAALKLFY